MATIAAAGFAIIGLCLLYLGYIAYRVTKEIRKYWDNYPFSKDPFNE